LIEAMSNAESVRIEAPRGVGCGEGVSPLPTGGGVWGGGSVPSPENFSITDLKMVSFDAFWVVF